MTSGSDRVGPVVVGVDGSEASLLALDHAVLEAGWRGVPLHVLHALDVTPAVLHLAHGEAISTRELAESDRREIWKRVDSHLDGFEGELVRVERDGDPGPALIEYTRAVGGSVLVVGPRGRGRVVEALLGSTAHKAVADAHCDVLVVKS
jgi:nucleotide-binding universal stress UspA family protein